MFSFISSGNESARPWFLLSGVERLGHRVLRNLTTLNDGLHYLMYHILDIPHFLAPRVEEYDDIERLKDLWKVVALQISFCMCFLILKTMS